MKSCFARLREADLISSEAVGGRFHPNSFGFHPAKQDFIKFVWFAGIVSSLQAFLFLSVKIKSFNLWGIVQLLIRLKELLIFNGLCDIINSPKIQNLAAAFKMINKLGGDLYG